MFLESFTEQQKQSNEAKHPAWKTLGIGLTFDNFLDLSPTLNKTEFTVQYSLLQSLKQRDMC